MFRRKESSLAVVALAPPPIFLGHYWPRGAVPIAVHSPPPSDGPDSAFRCLPCYTSTAPSTSEPDSKAANTAAGMLLHSR
eukprot:3079029-Rhodomonas_salina.3